MLTVCGPDSSALWQGPAVGSSEPSFPNFLSSWMTLPSSEWKCSAAILCLH